MFVVRGLTLVALVNLCHGKNQERKLFPLFYSYEPRSAVVDHAAIDLDLKEISDEVSTRSADGFMNGFNVYNHGAHSRPYAILKLDSPITFDLPYNTIVTGISARDNHEIGGTVLKDVENGKTELQFLYDISDDLSNPVGCQVGGSSSPIVDGCLASSGTIRIGSSGTPMTYTYDPHRDNKNGRRFEKFSTEAEEKMNLCKHHCPYKDYKKFYNYYNVHHYADEWVRSAFIGLETNFKNGVADFSLLSRAGRVGAVKAGTAFMSLWMYIIREMEVAVTECVNECSSDECTKDSVHAWDQAVAFYTGSLEQTGTGYFLYSLANEMCSQFGTCESEDAYTAKVNTEIFEEFNEGQQRILDGECSDVEKHKNRIVQLMTVPLVQSTLSYAYLLGVHNDTREETRGTGGTFAASILPLVHDCNEDDAFTIYQTMRIGRKVLNDYNAVKSALESNYECMGITSEDVGILTNVPIPPSDDKNNNNVVIAASSSSSTETSSGGERTQNSGGKSPGFISGVTVAVIVGLAALAVFYRNRTKSDIEFQGRAAQELEGRGGEDDAVFVENNNNYSDYTDGASGNMAVKDESTRSGEFHDAQDEDDDGFPSVRLEI